MVQPSDIGFVLHVYVLDDHIILFGFLRIIKQLIFIGILIFLNFANLSHLLRYDKMLKRLIFYNSMAIR